MVVGSARPSDRIAPPAGLAALQKRGRSSRCRARPGTPPRSSRAQTGRKSFPVFPSFQARRLPAHAWPDRRTRAQVNERRHLPNVGGPSPETPHPPGRRPQPAGAADAGTPPRIGITKPRILRPGLAPPDGGSPQRLIHQTLQPYGRPPPQPGSNRLMFRCAAHRKCLLIQGRIRHTSGYCPR